MAKAAIKMSNTPAISVKTLKFLLTFQFGISKNRLPLRRAET
jgi:hypothetical protein